MHVASNSYGMYLYEARQRWFWYSPPYYSGGNWVYATPWLWYDGNQHGSYDYSNWGNQITGRMNQPSPLTITMWGEYDPGTRIGTIYAKYRNDSTFTINGNALFLITEDSIYQSTPAGDRWHNYVARDYMPDHIGSSVSIAPGESIILSQPFTLSSSWNLNQCQILTWVQNPVMQTDSTKEIYQGAMANVDQLTLLPQTLTVNISGNGSVIIDPDTSEYTYGSWVHLTANAGKAGWHFMNWSDSLTGSNNPDSILMNCDKVVTANFAIDTFTIQASAGTNGTISPDGDIDVIYGTDQTFYFTPDAGCAVDDVLVDMVSYGAISEYTFFNVTNNHTIHVEFSRIVPFGWSQTIVLPTQVGGKFVKDGGALVSVTPSKDNGYIYAFRGQKSGEFYMYDPSALTWTLKESLPWGLKPDDPTKYNKKQVAKGGALCWNGSNIIYATKGNSTKEFWAYGLTTKSGWTPKEYIPVLKKVDAGTGMVAKDGKVYLLAGGQKSEAQNFFIYDEATNIWTTGSKAPVTPNNKAWKNGSGLTLIGNTIYAWKGKDKYCPLWAYDITTNTWTEKESCPVYNPILEKKVKTGDGGSITNDGEYIYTTKGGKQDFWMYTPSTPGVWTAIDTIPQGPLLKKGMPKAGASLAYLNGVTYLLKGNKTNEFWQYVPTEMLKGKTQKSKLITSIQTEEILKQVQNDILITVTPNPISRNTQIRYSVPTAGKVSIKLYNTTGRLIETFINEYQSAGSHTLNIDNIKISNGIYYLRYETMNNRIEVKIIKQ